MLRQLLRPPFAPDLPPARSDAPANDGGTVRPVLKPKHLLPVETLPTRFGRTQTHPLPLGRISFAAVVALPIAIAALYYFAIAADQGSTGKGGSAGAARCRSGGRHRRSAGGRQLRGSRLRLPAELPVQRGADIGFLEQALTADRSLDGLLGPHPRELSRRIHFMGACGGQEFLSGMAICDAVVLPYIEVGQSSSGPISQALELGCRVIASRTRAFLEFAKYHPDAIEFFDIGNHLELAERLRSRRAYPPARFTPVFNTETNKAVYLLANSDRSRSGDAEANAAAVEAQVKGAD